MKKKKKQKWVKHKLETFFAGLSLEGLAHELKSLQGLQRIAVVSKERVVGKFTGDSRQLSVRDLPEQVRAAWVAQLSEKEADKLRFLWSHLSTAVKEELQSHPAENRHNNSMPL